MVTKAKILITGAPGGTQGATAGKIVESAVDRGIPIAALVRNHDNRSKRLADIGAEIVIGDLLNLQDVISATSGRDTVFFCYPMRPGLSEASSIMAYAAWEAKLKREKIREEDFYDAFGEWLINELEECTRSISVGGNRFKDKWGTPDVVGVREARRSDIIKPPTEIVSVEYKA